MTQDEIIELARQAGAKDYGTGEEGVTALMLKDNAIEAFAKLVAEREREKLRNIAFFDMWHKEMNAAVLAEREACAKICEDFADVDSGPDGVMYDYHAHLIRARGQQ